MKIASQVVEKVPAGNLSVTRGEFGAVWAAAESALDAGLDDECLLGVTVTCRWIAGQPVVSAVTRCPELPRSPVFGRSVRAEPETITEEIHAAARELVHARADRRPYLQGVIATFDWAWNGSGTPPVR